jgi:hypothetical protein
VTVERCRHGLADVLAAVFGKDRDPDQSPAIGATAAAQELDDLHRTELAVERLEEGRQVGQTKQIPTASPSTSARRNVFGSAIGLKAPTTLRSAALKTHHSGGPARGPPPTQDDTGPFPALEGVHR